MDARASPLSVPEFFREMARRIVMLWWLKMTGTVIGIAGFFALYFRVLRHPLFPVTVMPLTAVDTWITFRPEALGLYVSLWFYVGLLPALLRFFNELVAYVWQVLVLTAVGLGIFIFWPTAVPVREMDGARHAGFEWLRQIDATGNACPSLHVAFAVFSVIGLGKVLREMGVSGVVRGANWAWCAGICYSTVAIGQHVVWDVVAGAALGAAVGLFLPRIARIKKDGAKTGMV
ncbi:MAG: phosphatase PAP2 family protein [Undibacterium sp.]|nr:phosphatase PAP2 family protein [Opitutaceae bacterium]